MSFLRALPKQLSRGHGDTKVKIFSGMSFLEKWGFLRGDAKLLKCVP
jgi:hypothetical protein